LLGGGDWVRASDDPEQRDDVVFLGDARENLGDLEFSLVLTTRRLLPNKYPEDREAVADRIIAMRDEQRMTFPAIAAMLSEEGEVGARGASLRAKNVFDIYKKRKAHILNRTSPTQYSLKDIKIHPNTRVLTAHDDRQQRRGEVRKAIGARGDDAHGD
jgi:hypothetical protein